MRHSQTLTNTEGALELISRISESYRKDIRNASLSYNKRYSEAKKKRLILLIRGWVNHPILSLACVSSVEMMKYVNAFLDKEKCLTIDDLRSYPGEYIDPEKELNEPFWTNVEGYDDYKEYSQKCHVHVNINYLQSLGYKKTAELASVCECNIKTMQKILRTGDSTLETILRIGYGLGVDIRDLIIGKPYATEKQRQEKYYMHALNMEEVQKRIEEKGFESTLQFSKASTMGGTLVYRIMDTGHITIYGLERLVFDLDCEVEDILSADEVLPEQKYERLKRNVAKWRKDGYC